MKKLVKNIISMTIIMSLTLGLMACGSSNKENKETESNQSGDTVSDTQDSKQSVTGSLSILTDATGSEFTALSQVNDRFMEEYPNIKVEFVSLGADYENTMKVKMASNKLPDVFSTHGWAKLRYNDYLMDLKDEAWAKDIDPAIWSLVTDGDKVLALPMDSYRTGFVYNVSILEEYGIEVPETLDELEAAFAVIKEKSGGTVSGLHIGGGDNWMYGAIINTLSTPLTSTDVAGAGPALLDGTYDWNEYKILPEKLLEYYNKGYLNKDCLTATFADTTKALAENKAAFVAMGPELITGALEVNPDFVGAIMPIPAIHDGDTPSFQGGEKNSWGIWKDTKEADLAKLYLEFSAQPENIELICQATSSPSGLVTVEPDLGDLGKYWTLYENNPVYPMWDRTYMPNGMWDVMSVAGQDLIGGSLDADGFVNQMKSEYLRLREVAENE